MKTTRREFIKLTAAVLGSLALGLKLSPAQSGRDAIWLSKPFIGGVKRRCPFLFDNLGIQFVTIDEIPGDELTFVIDDDKLNACLHLGPVVSASRASALVNITIDSARIWRDAVWIEDGNGNLWRTVDEGEHWVKA